MSATPPVRCPPVAEEILLELKRTASIVRVSRSVWEDGRVVVVISFSGLRAPEPRWRHVVLQPHEVGRVARALLDVCDRERWWS